MIRHWLAAILLTTLVAPVAFAQTTAPAQAQAQSQDDDGGGIGFGVAFGMSRPSLRGDDELGPFSPEGRNGLLGGLWFGGNRNGTLGVGAEVLYGIKNFEFAGADLKQHYIEVPVLLRLNVGSRSRSGLSVYGVAGPVADIRLSAKLADLDVTDDFQGFDLGVLAGAGIEVARIGVEVRGNWGMRAFFDPSEGSQEIKTFAIQVLAKLRIN